MNLDSLLAVAALLVAVASPLVTVYVKIPRHKKLGLKMRFDATAWGILIIPCVVLLYMQFYSFFNALGLTPNLGLHRWGITPYNASFVVLICTPIVLGLYIGMKKLSVSDIPKFYDYFFQLKNEKEYNELFSFIYKNFDLLEKILLKKFWLMRIQKNINDKNYAKARDFLQQMAQQKTQLKEIEESPSKNLALNKILRKIDAFILRICPNYEKEISLADEIYRTIRKDEELIDKMCANRPDIVISILRMDIRENYKYAGLCLRRMIKDNRSRLSDEIKNGYNPDQSEPAKKYNFLNLLFDDCNVAHKLEVWRPIGEFVISELNDLRLNPDADKYNYPEEDDNQRDFAEKLPLFNAVEFFNIMVKSTLEQKINRDIWVNYFNFFAGRILKNLNPNKEFIDINNKFPTRYHQLLYEMVSLLSDWATSVLPSDKLSSAKQMAVRDGTEPSFYVINSIMIALVGINKKIIMSEKVESKFKNDILGIVYDCYFKLRKSTEATKYAETLRNAIRCGGSAYVGMEHGIKNTPIQYKEFILYGIRNHEVADYELCELNHVEELRKILSQDLKNYPD